MFATTALRLASFTYLASVTLKVLSRPISLFSWHPLFMAGLWVVCTEGVMAFQAKKQKKKDKAVPLSRLIDAHQSLMMLGSFLGLIGFGVIYVVKSVGQKSHFASDHGFAGLLILITYLLLAYGSFLVRMRKMGSTVFWECHQYGGIGLMVGIWVTSWLHIGHPEGWLLDAFKADLVTRGSLAVSGILTLSVVWPKQE
ncbi:hypothetical protein HDU91_006921 [Kappamyces sp. JEL0680]|nr:hypothetical protein HDU91_006921 [Kappamyces sp. JEL0680]